MSNHMIGRYTAAPTNQGKNNIPTELKLKERNGSQLEQPKDWGIGRSRNLDPEELNDRMNRQISMMEEGK